MTFPILPSNASGGYQTQRSLRFNSADSAYLDRTPSVAGNRKTWTWSGWVKRSGLEIQGLFECGTATSNRFFIRLESDTSLLLNDVNTNVTSLRYSMPNVFRDTSAWYHFVVAVDTTQAVAGNRVKVYVNNTSITLTTINEVPQNYDTLVNSVVPNRIGTVLSAAQVPSTFLNGYHTEINFIDGQALDPSYFGATNATTGQWEPKAYSGSYGTNGFYLPFSDNSANYNLGQDYSVQKNQLLYSQDFSQTAWDKVDGAIITSNTTTAPDGTMTASSLTDSASATISRIRQNLTVTSTNTFTYSCYAKSNTSNYIGVVFSGLSAWECAIKVNLSNGSIVSAGNFSGRSAYVNSSVTSVGNGWYRISISFTPASTSYVHSIVTDSTTWSGLSSPATSTNAGTIYVWGAQLEVGPATDYIKTTDKRSNYWTPNNFSVTAGAGNDSLIDVPTNWADGGNGRGNYATWNPLSDIRYGIPSNTTFSNGNLEMSYGSGMTNPITTIGIPVGQGKYYCEIVPYYTTPSNSFIGVAGMVNGVLSAFTTRLIFYEQGGAVYSNYAGTLSTGSASSYASGSVVGITVDAGSRSINMYVNGVYQVTCDASSIVGLTEFHINAWIRNSDQSFVANFGQRPFAYTPPSGFKALNTQNLPSPTIAKGNTRFNPVLYTGDSNASTVISGVGFQPDFVWIKNRSKGTSGEGSNMLFDVIRGVQKTLQSNLTDAEQTQSNFLTAFNADGFTPGTATRTNENGSVYVAWNWKANGAGVTNTEGTITSTVSANPTAGFSIVTYTGATSGTVGHGLGVAPSMIICKSRSGTTDWPVYHVSLGKDNALVLSSTSAAQNLVNYWGSSTPGASVFGLWSSSGGNNNGSMVAYCFAAIPGYSAFGSYTGNGSADGPFVYTGFRPRFIMLKCSSFGGSAGYDWIIQDTARSPNNLADQKLTANSAYAENTDSGGGSTVSFGYDILSNGFKIRNGGGGQNANGQTYIFAAFAESPFKYANAR